MYTENAQRAINLQLMVNYQIDKYESADPKLVDDLENMFDNLTSEEIDQVLEWYNTQKQGKEEVLAQWDI